MQIVEGTRLGGYRVVRKIGEGGMGAVFEGVHERLQKRVAIKTLHEQFARDASAVARFTREGRAASRIRHGHVIDVTDVGMEAGTPYLVMELLDGESLASLIRRHGPLGSDAIADIALPVCDALQAAHDAGIVHRDLKPENIFLARSRSGTDVHPMVLDFGISAIEDEVRMTKTAHFMGTPHYMSPEQAQSARAVDGRSDQFSLGLVLFELVTGRRALNGDSVLEVVHRVSTEGAIRLGTVRPDLPRHFTSIVDRMTERDPSLRYGSMREVGAALLPYASPRGGALWGHAFAPGTIRSSIPIPAARPSVPTSAGTLDAARPSFSTPGASSSASASASGAPGTRPSFGSGSQPAPASFSTPGQPHPVMTPSFRPRSPSSPPSRIGTDPTLDAQRSAPASTAPPAPKRGSTVLLAVIAVAAVAAAIGIAVLVGTTLAHEQQAAPPASGPTAPTAPPTAPTTTSSAPPPTTAVLLDVRVRALPPSAEIVLDGTVVGTGTYLGSVAHDGIPHLLEVRAEGYVPHDIQFLDIAPVATITLDAVPTHHRGPVVAQHSEMTDRGLVEASTPPPPPQPRSPLVTQGAAAPSTGSPAPTGPAAGATGAAHDVPAGQAPGSGGAAPAPSATEAPPTTDATATPPPSATDTPPSPPPATAPPPTSGDGWGETASDDLVPFE